MTQPSFHVFRAVIVVSAIGALALLTERASSKSPGRGHPSDSRSKPGGDHRKPIVGPHQNHKDSHQVPAKPAAPPKEYSFLSREVKGNKVVERYKVTTIDHVWNEKLGVWEQKPKYHVESITKPLGGTSPAQPGGTGPTTVASAPAGSGSLTGSGGVSPASSSLSVGPEQSLPLFVAKYLRIENRTGEKLTVHVQFLALNDRNKWTWLPSNPAQSTRAHRYTYAPDEAATLEDSTGRVRASQVRIWARTESGKEFTKYKNEGYWLIGQDGEGQHRYYSTAMQTSNYVFN